MLGDETAEFHAVYIYTHTKEKRDNLNISPHLSRIFTVLNRPVSRKMMRIVSFLNINDALLKWKVAKVMQRQ